LGMKRTQRKQSVQNMGFVSAGLCLSIGIKIDIRAPFPNPLGGGSKIPEIGVNLFCLKIISTEFHVFNSIGFRKGLKLWSSFRPLGGRNFEKP
ncbi:hypothetical protein, partial [Escherichia coli]|uniref:hypothetical protein n=1 Tax=Escherichia coli TaxID=562 RepID=UPI001BE44610